MRRENLSGILCKGLAGEAFMLFGMRNKVVKRQMTFEDNITFESTKTFRVEVSFQR
jgi:hypothetical protein